MTKRRHSRDQTLRVTVGHHVRRPNQDKDLAWLHGEVGTPPFSKDARREAGELPRRLQRGEHLSLPQSRPMPDIGRRCHELRIQDDDNTWRIVYRIDDDAIVRVSEGTQDGYGKEEPPR